MRIFCKKNVYSLKNTVLSCNLFQFFIKNPLLSCPNLVKKRQICQNYNVYGPTKLIVCRFFRLFTKKHCSHAHIFSKKRQFSQKHIALMPIFCQKTSILTKLRCSHVIFFNIFFNSMLSFRYLVKKRKFSQN